MPGETQLESSLVGIPAGRRLGRYELRAKIADGGMAEVFVARPLDATRSLDRTRSPGVAGDLIAIKTIREEFVRNPEFVTMFLDEAKIVSRLRHPNVIRYHELGRDGEQLFLAMDLLFGQSLWAVWDACRARGVRLRYDMIAWIGARVAEGLHYAHAFVDENGRGLDIVHRDVNATNIFVTYDGEIKVIDFGLAKAANRASKTAAGVIKGKVAYMSPEQAVGAPVDRRTDIFALGTTLWELSCDRRLFKCSDDVETLKRVQAADVPDPTRLVDGYPPELWRVLEHALERDKDRRYATAAELARDLDAFAVRSGTDAAAVASVMRELFAQDRSRQVAWVTDASLREPGPSSSVPLKAPSRFWVSDDVPPARSTLSDPPPEGTPVSTAVTRSRGRLALIVALLAAVVGSVLAFVLLR